MRNTCKLVYEATVAAEHLEQADHCGSGSIENLDEALAILRQIAASSHQATTSSECCPSLYKWVPSE